MKYNDRYVSPNVVCDYYKYETYQLIACDNGELNIRNVFADRGSCLAYKKKFCKGNPQECEIFKMLGGTK